MKRDIMSQQKIKLSFGDSAVDFILQTPLFEAIRVSGKVTFFRRRNKKSLIDQLSTVQTILSEFEQE